MYLLQAYQAELLGDHDEGGGCGQATDLSLRAMAALVATERHLWLNQSNIKGKDKIFLMDAPISPSGLFGDAVNSVVERFQ